MISLQTCNLFGRYNRWQNENLMSLANSLSDEERKRDRGAPFRSIHGTVNHLLLADHLWLGRFTGDPFPAQSLDQELYDDWDELSAARKEMDDAIEAWVSSLTEETLRGPLTFTAVSRPITRTVPFWSGVVQFFNHQTHHRGQIGTLLEQAGCDIGATYILWLPVDPEGE